MGKKKGRDGAGVQEGTGSKKEEARSFDFSKCSSRQIALQISYVGWDYQGFASQEDTDNTIEGHLFGALKKTCLIQSRESSHYSRCARTDKGVSAQGQVVSVRVRSKLDSGLGVFPAQPQASAEAAAAGKGGHDEAGRSADRGPAQNDDEVGGKQYWLHRQPGPPHPGLSTEDAEQELPYIQMLNACLPAQIRVLAWCPVVGSFNARFACSERSYRYFFTKGDLNIAAMRQACHLLIGEHDFRNFCKIDKSKGPNQVYRRKIHEFECEPVVAGEGQGRFSPWSLNIRATAFLWHQVRAMAAVLFAVGRGQQPPSFVSFMLDIAQCHIKPAYNIASEEPLLLCDCIFPEDLVNFQPPVASHVRNEHVMASMCSSLVCRAALVEAMDVALCARSVRVGQSSEERNGKRSRDDGQGAGAGVSGAGGLGCEEGSRAGSGMQTFSSLPRAGLVGYIPNHKGSALVPAPGTRFVQGNQGVDAGVGDGLERGTKRKLGHAE